MATLEDALLAVYRQSLLENKKTVTLEDQSFPVRSTAKRKLKQIDFQFDGRELRGLEQNPYDPLSRLSTALTTGSTNYPQWGLSWGYDRYGNRKSQTLTAGSGYQGSVTVDPATNHITGSPYTYDTNGNMTNDGMNTLTYDAENHSVTSSGTLGSGAYTYDGNGFRVKKVSGSTTTVYVFSGSKVISEYDNGAAPTAPSREYVYGGGTLLAKIDSGGTKYYHQDHLSNRLVTSSTGTTLEQMGHFPFGDSWYNATNDKLYFTSYERDAESGNDYAMARYYVWRIGRFLSLDPLSGSISDPQSLDRYTYVENNPINLADPSGQIICVVSASGDCVNGGAGFGFGGGFYGGGGNGDIGNGPACLAACGATLPGYVSSSLSSPQDYNYFSGSSFHIDPEGGVDYYPGLNFFAGLPSGDVYGGGQAGPAGGGGDGILAQAVERASVRLFKEECANLFNNGANPGIFLEGAFKDNKIRAVPFGADIPAGVGAQTNTDLGVVYIASNRYFFTGQFNGGPVTQTTKDFKGLSQDQVQVAVLIHELLHLTGSVGEDNANQTITLGNAQVVNGSGGVTAAVIQHCIKNKENYP